MTTRSYELIAIENIGGMERAQARQWLYHHVDSVRADLGLPSQRAEAVVRVRANVERMVEELQAVSQAARLVGQSVSRLSAVLSPTPASSGPQIADSE